MTQTHLEQISANERFRELARFFESVLVSAFGTSTSPPSSRVHRTRRFLEIHLDAIFSRESRAHRREPADPG